MNERHGEAAGEKVWQGLLGTGGCQSGRRYRLDMVRTRRGLTSKSWGKREETK
jgi:hypothetical protein